jgi:nucleotide-binding universal stress UspA family protein
MYTRIVVGTDGSPTAFEAVEHAKGLAEQCGAELHIVTGYKPVATLLTNPEFATMSAALYAELDPAAGAAEVTSRAVEACGKTSVFVKQHQVPGHPSDALCEVAKSVDADLIVVGNRGMSGARRVLGSVPNSVAHNASCSVLIVHTA